MKEIKYIKLPISELKNTFGNPRKISKDAMESLKKSIQELGDFGVIVIDEYNQVISGNQRIEALKQLDIQVPIDCKQLIGYSEKEKKIINIRANKTSGIFDDELLTEWLKDIDLDFDIDITGFDDKDLNKLGFNNTETKEDDYEIPEKIKTDIKRGDLIEIGRHRLLCGDSTAREDVERLMNGKKVDMVFTDPPYGINAVKVKGKKEAGGAGKLGFIGKSKAYYQIEGDDSIESAKKFYELCNILGYKDYIIWGGNYFTSFLPPSRCWLIWDKKEKEINTTFADCEIAWCSIDGNSRIYRHLWAGRLRKGKITEELKARVHPTQKPVGLFKQIFNDYKFELCYDGFVGSGSTMVACHQLSRTCYGIEISPEYCQVIIDRMIKFDSTLEVKINEKEYVKAL
jgi:DNA modification methylase